MALILVDGYNVLLVARRGADQSARDQLIRAAASYRGRTGADVCIVFDAPRGSGTESATSLPGVRTLYANDADDAIVDRVRRARRPQSIVVVTSDRDLSERVRQLGAKTRDGSWFLGRVTAAPSRPSEKPATVSPDEVEYWLRRFSEPRDDDEL